MFVIDAEDSYVGNFEGIEDPPAEMQDGWGYISMIDISSGNSEILPPDANPLSPRPLSLTYISDPTFVINAKDNSLLDFQAFTVDPELILNDWNHLALVRDRYGEVKI